MEYTIGYMPHVEGNWSGTQGYSPLAIVYNENKSYISKVEVPSGTAITNTYYWHPFADGAQGTAGQDGAQGIQGIPGTAAAQGAQGATGANGTNGTNGSSIFYYLEQLINGQIPDQNKIVNPMRLRVNPGNILIDMTGQVGYLDRDGKWIFSYHIQQGAQGAAGSNGTNGQDGAQGYQGQDGAQGSTGAQGAWGVQGYQGLQGISGAAAVGTWGVKNVEELEASLDINISLLEASTYYIIPDVVTSLKIDAVSAEISSNPVAAGSVPSWIQFKAGADFEFTKEDMGVIEETQTLAFTMATTNKFVSGMNYVLMFLNGCIYVYEMMDI